MDLHPAAVKESEGVEDADGQMEGGAITWIWTGGERGGAPATLGVERRVDSAACDGFGEDEIDGEGGGASCGEIGLPCVAVENKTSLYAFYFIFDPFCGLSVTSR